MRVSLPDRPGALGQVTRVLGTIGADIHQVTVLGREGGRAVDDFTVAWPGDRAVPGEESGEVQSDMTADVRDRLAAVPGVSVEGVWRTREVPGSTPGYDLLRYVVADPVRAFATLVDALPDLVGADWALTVATGRIGDASRVWADVVHRSLRAPEGFVPTGSVPPRAAVSADGGVGLLCVPLEEAALCLVVGRAQGAAFHRAELDSVARLVEVVSMLAATGEATAVG
ncbi:amino acid-binding protein [Spongiactinospora sp. TRM90649]|uniref:amino acid-binding protein n=1 Tax=Spongiactinospora sp. TRM90649 TaxID=3031114 RepID=UPI0023F90E5A|nr:amino acid-binding protein [Spongiactinospora sp. TRM90649]MDF5753885.1 amino acid-binding protein [Spongiactinospora sp. TRM90649]